MDRRTWMQLMSVLAAAGLPVDAQQQPPGRGGVTTAPPATDAPAGRGGRGFQQLQMLVTKDQIQAALKLLALEFQDAEIDMMLNNVNRNLYSYEQLRKVEVPYDTEPAFTFHPGLPDRKPLHGPLRFEPTVTRIAGRAPRDLEELAFRRVTELAPLVHSHAVSSTALTKMYLARMKQYSPKLLCLVTLTEDVALEQAADADREIRAGRYRGPLHGIPFGVKDLFDTKDVPTTWGAEPFQKRIPTYNATVIERLHKAGAVMMAKLSMGALAMGDLWFAGQTKSPWPTAKAKARGEYDRGSSGSSAGSGASTAAGLVGFSLGTETLGSIVSPSTACGVTGLRPTYGRVSRHGAMALSWTMDKIGPICRGVEDCALVLRAIYGPDGYDRSVGADPFHWEPHRPLSTMKIGVYQKGFDQVRDDADKKVYAQALADLKKAGVFMTPVEFEEDLTMVRFLLEAEGAAAFDDITRDGQVRTLRGQTPGSWPNSFRSNRLVPAVEYIRAQRARSLLVAKFEKFMADWDVVVIPPTSLLTTTNLTGNPQVVTKCGFVDGVPRTIGFLGRIYEEGAPLRVALAYERATDWHKMNPTLFS
jgi:Asp-tRNA(Asn)/Glu-tRNA(Gln) amidotransferase A subunit family amidase